MIVFSVHGATVTAGNPWTSRSANIRYVIHRRQFPFSFFIHDKGRVSGMVIVIDGYDVKQHTDKHFIDLILIMGSCGYGREYAFQRRMIAAKLQTVQSGERLGM